MAFGLAGHHPGRRRGQPPFQTRSSPGWAEPERIGITPRFKQPQQKPQQKSSTTRRRWTGQTFPWRRTSQKQEAQIQRPQIPGQRKLSFKIWRRTGRPTAPSRHGHRHAFVGAQNLAQAGLHTVSQAKALASVSGKPVRTRFSGKVIRSVAGSRL